MALHIEKEANRCLCCKVPMCSKNCPIHTPVPEVIKLFKENRIMDAGKLLFENNPMSLVCSIVCNHEGQCYGNCVLGRKDKAVAFFDIEKFISDSYLDRMKIDKAQPNGRSVAVIGSGPAGMTASIILAKNGYDVTIFERKDNIGGMLRYGIPEFRLSNSVIKRYHQLLKRLGVKVRLNTTIGGALTIEDLFLDGYSSIFVGTGVWRPNTLGIRGETLSNVHFGISYLENPDHHNLGETVAIVGMGNVAMDIARTAFRHGAQRVMLFANTGKATASSHEIDYTKLEGAEFYYNKSIVRITPDGPVFRDSVLDESGNVIGQDGEEELVRADSTIIAISQGPKDKLIMSTEHLEGTSRGLLIVDENSMTTRDGVFAAGDVVTGPLTVVHAASEAKKAAYAMMEYMDRQTAVSDH